MAESMTPHQALQQLKADLMEALAPILIPVLDGTEVAVPIDSTDYVCQEYEEALKNTTPGSIELMPFFDIQFPPLNFWP